MKIHSGDLVKVIAGKDKGKEAKVLSVDTKAERVIVEGVNIAKKHVKGQGNVPGQIVEIERAIHVSNVMVIDPSTKKPTRIGFKIEGGKKIRIAKKSRKALA